MADSFDLNFFALRRLNPFSGVEQVIEINGGRARSSNGCVWQLELQSRAPAEWGSLNQHDQPRLQWYLQALWSEQDGQVDIPRQVLPGASQSRPVCEALIEQIRILTPTLPFQLRDQQECWLLDSEEEKPLVLLHSTLSRGTVQTLPRQARWLCVDPATESRSLPAFPQAKRLEAMVARRAGIHPKIRWVIWNNDRSRVHSQDGEDLPVQDFPQSGILQDGNDTWDSELVSTYLAWIAPALLTLPYLTDTQRAWLETRLIHQSASIEYHWHLYPKILDQTQINAARVASRLQSAAIRQSTSKE